MAYKGEGYGFNIGENNSRQPRNGSGYGNGQRSDRPSGARPVGTQYGERPSGARPVGSQYGDRPSGARPVGSQYGERPSGARPVGSQYGERPSGARPVGTQYGERPSGVRPVATQYGERPSGARPVGTQHGDRPSGARPVGTQYGERPSGARPVGSQYGERPSGARPVGEWYDNVSSDSRGGSAQRAGVQSGVRPRPNTGRTVQQPTRQSSGHTAQRYPDGRDTRGGYGERNEPVNRNARRIDLTEEQRVAYERAYRAKHGRSPYVGGVSEQQRGGTSYGTAPREDRRQAFLREEEERLRREVEAARQAELKLREEQAAARRAAEAEKRRREAAARRAAEERVREAERQRAELERRRAYEENKREYERKRRIEKQKEKIERRKKLEKKLKRRRFLRCIVFHLRVILVAFLVTTIIYGSVLYLHFWKDDAEFSHRVTYLYGDTKVSGIPGDIAYCDGVMRIDIIRVAELFGFYTVGDSKQVKFIISDETLPQYIKIIPGSRWVEINGTPVVLSTSSEYEGNSLWVSAEIMNCFEGGVTFETKGAGNASVQKIISRDEDGKARRDSENNLIYDKVILTYKNQDTLMIPDLSVIYGDESLGIGIGTTVTFNTDLADYELYMNPSDSTSYLVLASKQNLLASDYIPEALTDVAGVRDGAEGSVQLRFYAAKALEAMLIEMKDAGYKDVFVTEGYVSYQAQVEQFNAHIAAEMANGYSENDAMRQVLTYFSAPGTNEHQTGLAVDIHNLTTESVAFAEEEAFHWLRDNCWKFGFILRYPEGKEDVTGHSFEPWHFRYVGRFAAEKIYRDGITLEEYLKGER